MSVVDDGVDILKCIDHTAPQSPERQLVVFAQLFRAGEKVLLVQDSIERRGVAAIREARSVRCDAIANRSEWVVERERQHVESAHAYWLTRIDFQVLEVGRDLIERDWEEFVAGDSADDVLEFIGRRAQWRRP